MTAIEVHKFVLDFLLLSTKYCCVFARNLPNLMNSHRILQLKKGAQQPFYAKKAGFIEFNQAHYISCCEVRLYLLLDEVKLIRGMTIISNRIEG